MGKANPLHEKVIMGSIAKTFWGLLLAGLLLAASSAAQSPAPPLKSARPASDDSIQSQTQQQQGTLLYFPDYVEGGVWSVQLMLGNIDPTRSVQVVVEAYDSEGQTVPGLFESGSPFEIPSRGSRVLRSAGAGAPRRGWIEVRAEPGSVNGLLTYRNSESGVEVGVQPVQLRDQFALFVEETSEIGTGLAIFKPDASPEIEFQIRDEAGSDPIGEVLRWGDFQQQARTLPQWFENVDTGFLTDFRGLLFLRAADDSSFAPLGLRFGKRKESTSAVPVIRTGDAVRPPNSLQPDPPGLLYFPDYVEGGGWSVQLMLGNIDPTRSVQVVVEVYDPEGQTVPGLFESESPFEIPPRGSRVLRSAGGEATRRGWIEVRAEPGSVNGLLTYRNSESGVEVGVQPVQLRDQFALFVEETSEIGTGLAIFKPDASPEIEFQIRDEAGSDPIGEVLRWGDFQQQARTLPQWFENVDTGFLTDFRGLLFLRAADDSSFAPLGLRFAKQEGSVSAVPVIPIRDAGAGKMYWTDEGTDKIQRANLDGSGVQDLVTSGLSGPKGLALDLGAGKMYWADSRTDKIQRANLDGSGVEDLVRLPRNWTAGPWGLALDLGAGKMYWTAAGTGKIQRANLDGSGVEDLVTSRLDDPRGLALDLGAGKMYWADCGTYKIQRANLDGSGVEDLVTLRFLRPRGLALDLGAGKMYWTNWGGIQRANLDGSGVEDLVTSRLDDPRGLALDLGAGKMYWTELLTNKIQRANLDGSGVQDLVTSGLSSPIGLALDLGAGKMYWADSWRGKIQRANLDGSGVQDLVTSGLDDPVGLALDLGAGKMYWTDQWTNMIQRANLDGSFGVEDLVTSGLRRPEGLALDLGAGKMYWTDVDTDKIQRANLDGSGVEDLVTSGLYHPAGLALDPGAGKMYWTDAGTEKIQRANLDGSGVENLVTSGLDGPAGLALDLGAGKMYWTDAGTEKIQRANLDGSGVEDLVTSGLDIPVGSGAGPGRRQDVLDGLGDGQDPAGQPGRQRGGRPRHVGIGPAHWSGAGPGGQLKPG